MQKKSKKEIAIFEGQNIRRHWDEEKELWYFSVVDVIRVLTDSRDARKYWNKLAQRLRDEGSEVVTKCHQLKNESTRYLHFFMYGFKPYFR